MDKTIILDHVDKYSKLNKSYFYDDIKTNIKNYPEIIFEIDENPYLLEAIRIFINYDDGWHISLSSEPIVDSVFRKVLLTDNQVKNIISQINALNDDDIKKLNNPNVDILDEKTNLYHFILHKNPITNKKILVTSNNVFGSSNIALGIDTLNVIKHQRLDRFNEYLLSKKKDIVECFRLFQAHYDKMKNISFNLNDKIMIFSGMTLLPLGLSYTIDVDLIVTLYNQSIPNLFIMYKYFGKKDYDCHILLPDGIWYKMDVTNKYDNKYNYKIMNYQQQWLTYDLPNLFGAKDIYEVFSNPKYHFHFMGLKFMCLEGFIARSIVRGSQDSFIDLIEMNKVNNINVKKMCMPYLSINQGRIRILDDKNRRHFLNNIKEHYKLWHNKHITVDELDKLIPYCSSDTFGNYSGRIVKDVEIEPLKYFHTQLKRDFIKKYANNADLLIDVGSGKLRDFAFWKEARIKQVFALEPSTDSVEKGRKRIESHNGIPKIKIINSVGDVKWDDFGISGKADCITFMFTIHYMSNNIDIIFDNLLKHTHIGSKIIIMLLDGNKIHNHFNKTHQNIVIQGKQEPLFIISPFYEVKKDFPDNENILVYMKGTYGVSKGSLEPIVNIDKLINRFETNNFKLIINKHLPELRCNGCPNLNYKLKEISGYYCVLVFERN